MVQDFGVIRMCDMGVLINSAINFDSIIRWMMSATVIITYGWYFRAISKYMDKRKYATKRINAVVAYRKTSKLIGIRSFHPVYYYVYIFTGLDEYEGVTFYDKSAKLEEQYRIGENVSLYINPENLGQFWVEKAKEMDKMIFSWIGLLILLGLMAIKIALKTLGV